MQATRTKRSLDKQGTLRTFRLTVTPEEVREICARIREAREQAGLRLRDMAELLGVELRSYVNYEYVPGSRKTPRVPWTHLKTIAKATNKPMEWFLHGQDAQDVLDTLARLERQNQLILGGLAKLGAVDDAAIPPDEAGGDLLLQPLDGSPPPTSPEAPDEDETDGEDPAQDTG